MVRAALKNRPISKQFQENTSLAAKSIKKLKRQSMLILQ